MKTSHTIFAVVLTAATLGGTAIAASAIADRLNANAADWLTIPAIYEKVTAAGYKYIHEIERERRGYDVEAYDNNGDRVELFIDPINGEVLDIRVKNDKSDKYRDQRFFDNRDHDNNRYSNNARR
ncbi:MAG: PepSY domain-containing protein [Halieaceae bacterium]|nr:PepSY domain-containing protein [Halieaceae bacterium]